MRQENDSCCDGVIKRFFRTLKEQAIWLPHRRRSQGGGQ
jgi:hypothetical protein